MSSTLGEKLRQAREERGLTISDIADQTRISALYLESIENDDYRILPGGIFNKGFVKSFARTVGINEQEALQDYAQLIGTQDHKVDDDHPKTYRPEVLTDDRSSSTLPTIIIAVIILGLMTWGILTLVKYIQQTPPPTAANTNANSNANTAANITLANTNSAPAATSDAPPFTNLKIEFKAVKSPVSLNSSIDGVKASSLVAAEQSKLFEPKQNVRLSYSKSKTANAELTINGKAIKLPTDNPNRNVIEFEISSENFRQIWDSGQINNGSAASPR